MFNVGCYSRRWVLLSSLGATLVTGCYYLLISQRRSLRSQLGLGSFSYMAELASLAASRLTFFSHSSVGGLCSMLGATLVVGCYSCHWVPLSSLCATIIVCDYLLISRRSSLRSQLGPGTRPGPGTRDPSLFSNHSFVGGLCSMLGATLVVVC